MRTNRLVAWIAVSLFAAGAAMAADPSFSRWMKSSALKTLVDARNEDRMFPAVIEGRLDGTSIDYRAQFEPFAANMERFETRWGITDRWYRQFSAQFERAGYSELSHTTFVDQVGTTLHQATWILVVDEAPPAAAGGTAL